MNKVWIFMLLMLLSLKTMACDICNMSISLVPEDNKHLFSMNYRSRVTSGFYSFSGIAGNSNTSASRHTGPGNGNTTFYGKNVREIFDVMDIKFRYMVNKRFMVSAILPYLHNQQLVEDKVEINMKGIGDPIVMANYMVINTKLSKPDSKLSMRVNLGGGIKMPLANYQVMKEDKIVELDMQPGTGSLDFIISGEQMIRYENFGISNSMSYKINTKNKSTYCYGNSWNQTISAFYLATISDNYSIMPNMGIYYEYADNDAFQDQYIPQSGGNIFYSSFGVEFYFKKVRIGTTYQHPIRNNLNGYSQLPVKNRILGDVILYF